LLDNEVDKLVLGFLVDEHPFVVLGFELLGELLGSGECVFDWLELFA